MHEKIKKLDFIWFCENIYSEKNGKNKQFQMADSATIWNGGWGNNCQNLSVAPRTWGRGLNRRFKRLFPVGA
jgi:hypothetical protein